MFTITNNDLSLDLNSSVDLYWLAEGYHPLRVKILAWEDRAKAQTAATLQDNYTLRRAFKRTLRSTRRPYTSERSECCCFFFLPHIWEDCFHRRCLSRDTEVWINAGFRETVYDFTVVTRLWRARCGGVGALLDWIYYSLAAKTVRTTIWTAPAFTSSSPHLLYLFFWLSTRE